MDKLIYFYSTPEEMLINAFDLEKLPKDCFRIIQILQTKSEEDMMSTDFEDLVDAMCQLKVIVILFQNEYNMFEKDSTFNKFDTLITLWASQIVKNIIKNEKDESLAKKFLDYVYKTVYDQL